MMDTTTATATSIVVVIAGRWAQDKPISGTVVVGGAALALFLAVLDNVDSGLASKFGLAVLLTALFTYGVPLARKLGWTRR